MHDKSGMKYIYIKHRKVQTQFWKKEAKLDVNLKNNLQKNILDYKKCFKRSSLIH